jgi:L-fucose mutarotase/ribose pyranase (RbsD/FucU family)
MAKVPLALMVLYITSFCGLPASAQSWQSHVKDELDLMGHRNWILIVDSAYPQQVGAGIEIIETNADQFDVVRTVLDGIKNSIHVRPIVFMDAELPFVSDQKAPGVSNYRAQITTLLGDYKVTSRLHQSLIDEVAKDGERYRVLILKTNLAIPYTSLFIHLDCKYWSSDDERSLREEMRRHGAK